MFLTGPSGGGFVTLTRQVREIFQDWPKKKATLFIKINKNYITYQVKILTMTVFNG